MGRVVVVAEEESSGQRLGIPITMPLLAERKPGVLLGLLRDVKSPEEVKVVDVDVDGSAGKCWCVVLVTSAYRDGEMCSGIGGHEIGP